MSPYFPLFPTRPRTVMRSMLSKMYVVVWPVFFRISMRGGGGVHMFIGQTHFSWDLGRRSARPISCTVGPTP